MNKIWQQPEIVKQATIILNSYRQLLGKELIDRQLDPLVNAETLFYAPMVVLSHNSDRDPLYNYGNLQALKLWEMSWEQLIVTPSRSTTEAMLRSEREKLLTETATKGFVTNYQCIRKSRTGKKYQIKDLIIWNLTDEQNKYCGQAASFSDWQILSSKSE